MNKKCERCDKEFMVYPYEAGRRRFCSINCANKMNAKRNSLSKIGEKNPMYGKRAWNRGLKYHSEKIGASIKKIYNSGKKIGFQKGNRTKSQFKKGHSGLVGEKNPAWQGGKSFEPYPTDWTEKLRRMIRERDNYICQVCGKYGKVIHHIDYNKNNCLPINLITLCYDCHRQTNGNREYWERYFGRVKENQNIFASLAR